VNVPVDYRYRNVNVAYFRPHQVRDLYDGADVNEVVRQSEQKGRKYGKNALSWFIMIKMFSIGRFSSYIF